MNDLQYVKNGEDVDASVTNRPTQQLALRVAELSRIVSNITNQAALVDQGVTVLSTALVGSPVAYDAVNLRYVPAVFSYDTNSPNLLGKFAEVRGIVAFKRSSTVADVAIGGVVILTAAQAAAVGLTVAGDYKLSPTPGMLSLTGVGAEVLYWDGNSKAYLTGQTLDPASAHAHYHLEIGTHHVETGAGPGWLKVGESGLPTGAPPHGAVYGYNLRGDPSLQAVWPPAPADQISLTVFKGGWDGYGHEVPPGTYIADATTIWWMTDAVGYRPWEMVTHLGGSSIANPTSIGGREGPLPKLVVSFSKVKYATTPATVTSLAASDPNGPIKISHCDGTPGATGPLLVTWSPSGEVETTAALGAAVIKQMVAGKQSIGNVTEGLVTLDDTIVLSSALTRHLNPADPDSPMVYQGVVGIRAIVEPADRTITPQLISLQDTVQRPDLLTIAFMASIDSSVIYKFVLPGPSRFPVNPTATLRVWLTGAINAALPAISVQYQRIPDPTGVQSLPVSETLVTPPTLPTVNAGQYADVKWPAFPVAAGDVVVVTLKRTGSSDGYSGEVGILNAVLTITAG